MFSNRVLFNKAPTDERCHSWIHRVRKLLVTSDEQQKEDLIVVVVVSFLLDYIQKMGQHHLLTEDYQETLNVGELQDGC
ncbi:hypothetical protein CHS0354_014920 [Potamilus streckersoni]|uniref:Uncharacterized protein n=1 Tax=Potamilus streckersoni TaxID=2493646 RepID=A0AAE0WAM7_9BIVA|nr:hypothetical protein CHS0354_014920 [Potamilus streckersoni]